MSSNLNFKCPSLQFYSMFTNEITGLNKLPAIGLPQDPPLKPKPPEGPAPVEEKIHQENAKIMFFCQNFNFSSLEIPKISF